MLLQTLPALPGSGPASRIFKLCRRDACGPMSSLHKKMRQSTKGMFSDADNNSNMSYLPVLNSTKLAGPACRPPVFWEV